MPATSALQQRRASGCLATTSAAPAATAGLRRRRCRLVARASAAAPAAAAPTATATATPLPEWAPAVDYTTEPAKVPQVAQAPATALLPPTLSGLDFFSPPLLDASADPLPLLRARVPFLTRAAGALPAVPASLDHALYRYGEYASKYVSVRVDDEHVKLRSWGHAVDTLRAAHASGASYWCSLLEEVRHPAWWPAQGHVANYDQVE